MQLSGEACSTLGAKHNMGLHTCSQHMKKGFLLCFDDGDTAWLVRRNVRPMLKRAPVPPAPMTGLARTQPHVGAASTPCTPLRLPIRFSHNIRPHEATEAIEKLLQDSDWKNFRLSELQAKLEAMLLPDEKPGWLTPRRHAVVTALEQACVLTVSLHLHRLHLRPEQRLVHIPSHSASAGDHCQGVSQVLSRRLKPLKLSRQKHRLLSASAT